MVANGFSIIISILYINSHVQDILIILLCFQILFILSVGKYYLLFRSHPLLYLQRLGPVMIYLSWIHLLLLLLLLINIIIQDYWVAIICIVKTLISLRIDSASSKIWKIHIFFSLSCFLNEFKCFIDFSITPYSILNYLFISRRWYLSWTFRVKQ